MVRLSIVGVGNMDIETKNFGRRDLLLKGSSADECMGSKRELALFEGQAGMTGTTAGGLPSLP